MTANLEFFLSIEFSDFDGLLKNDGNFEPVEVSTGDGAVIIHTAAVAGRPRGALLNQGNIISANTHINLLMNLSPLDVHLNNLPLFHVGGLFMACRLCLIFHRF